MPISSNTYVCDIGPRRRMTVIMVVVVMKARAWRRWTMTRRRRVVRGMGSRATGIEGPRGK
jgi:hypothetical protein